jgi:ornithine cyclodeaminase
MPKTPTPPIAVKPAGHPAADTWFIGAADMAELIRRCGLDACLSAVMARIETEFQRWEAYDKSPRLACHHAQGVVELMPVADASRFAFKYVNGHPGNTRSGLPTVMAFGVLADMDTGLPRLLCEMTLLTAIRTAAMSALAAQRLARPDSRCMALIGNGAQAAFQAVAMHNHAGIRELRLFDTDPAATDTLMTHLAGSGLQLRRCASTAEAVRGADIVTTVTADKTRAAILRPEMIEPGMHLNAVGGDCPGKTELHPGVLLRASVFCEYEPQTRIEGDIQQLPADFAVTEFWRVLTGQAAGRRSADEVTVFDSVGFALEDHAALSAIFGIARERRIGQPLDLIARTPDPKDLYSLIAPARDAAPQSLPLSAAALAM